MAVPRHERRTVSPNIAGGMPDSMADALSNEGSGLKPQGQMPCFTMESASSRNAMAHLEGSPIFDGTRKKQLWDASQDVRFRQWKNWQADVPACRGLSAAMGGG